MMTLISSLKDRSLFVDQNYIDGQWTKSESGETFEVHGQLDPVLPVDMY